MTVPTSYTEDTLQEYMHDVLGADEVASSMNWTPQQYSYLEAVYESLFVYGASDITTITGLTNIRKLRAIARTEVWRLVANRTAADYEIRIDGAGTYKRDQVHAHAVKMFELARKEAIAAGVTEYNIDAGDKPSVVSVSVSREGYDVS